MTQSVDEIIFSQETKNIASTNISRRQESPVRKDVPGRGRGRGRGRPIQSVGPGAQRDPKQAQREATRRFNERVDDQLRQLGSLEKWITDAPSVLSTCVGDCVAQRLPAVDASELQPCLDEIRTQLSRKFEDITKAPLMGPP